MHRQLAEALAAGAGGHHLVSRHRKGWSSARVEAERETPCVLPFETYTLAKTLTLEGLERVAAEKD